jgi:DNA/RNA-binding domain of Phe-tRNA-synthetase-like protein
MSFVVTPECRQLGLRAGAVVFSGVRVASSPPALRGEIDREAVAIQGRFADAAAVRSSPEVTAFHEVLRKVGANPRRDQPSVERLLTFALKRASLPVVNSLVDAYNLVSIRSGCSLGAHDLDRITLPVALRLLNGGEKFTPLGAEAEAVVNAGEYGYVDGRGRVLCRLDVVQADFSKVTADTVHALLIAEATTYHSPTALRQALNAATEAVLRQCGGTVESIFYPDP